MTAEVAIMNTKGIALAADSAVTLGVGKIYFSADKLFAMSKYHPVGIMIYNSASIMGIDWETIIKNYRDSLGKKSFDKLLDYKVDFINYLTKFPYYTTEKMVGYLKSTCASVFSIILRRFLDDLHAEFDGKENIELNQIDAVFNASLKKTKEEIKKDEDEKVIKLDSEFIDSNTEVINKMLDYTFENYKLSKKQIIEIIGILKLNFQKCKWINNYTGIVIAGYGEREIFPTCCEFKVGGKLGDSLIYFENTTYQIDTDWTARIVPFAQAEMVYQFVRGINIDYEIAVSKKVNDILISLLSLIKNFDKEKADAISKVLSNYMDKYANRVFFDPILDIIDSMQKSELTSMAEAMVNLTALKRHVSTDSETVGGPIDVALITKGEGFIWIKKKTNFDPNLNIHLKQNYFRGVINEEL